MSNVAPSLSEPAVSRPPRLRRVSQIPWWPSVALVVAVVSAMWVLRLNGPIDLRYDAGVYYVLGSSLATGQGYRIQSEPGAPVDIQYPPGLPALVAVHQMALGTTDPAIVGPVLRRTYMLLFLGLALVTLALARHFAGAIGGVIATLLCLAQTNTFLLSDMLFTELPYTLLSVTLALVLVSERIKQRPVLREALGFLLAASAFMLRTAGVALLLAWIVEALVQRRWRIASGRVLLAAMPVLLWQAHVMQVQASAEYHHPAYEYQRAPYQFYNVSYRENLALADPFTPELGRVNASALVSRLAMSFRTLPVSLGEAVSESMGFWTAAVEKAIGRGKVRVELLWSVLVIPIWLLTGLTVAGLVLLARRREWFLVTFCVASIVLVGTTPWPGQFLRYLAPLCPILAISVVVGTRHVGGWMVSRKSRWVGGTALAVLGALAVGTGGVQMYALWNSFQVRHHSLPLVAGAPRSLTTPKWFYRERTWTDWEVAIDWIGENAPRDAMVATDAPHLCYLRTGRRAVMPPMNPDHGEVRRLLEGVPVSYVVIDELEFLDVSRRYVLPALMSDTARWRLVYRINQTMVYEYVGTGNRRPPMRTDFSSLATL